MTRMFSQLAIVLSLAGFASSAFALCDLQKIVEESMSSSAQVDGRTDIRIQKLPRLDFTNGKDGEVSSIRYSYKTPQNPESESVMIGTLTFSLQTCEIVRDPSLSKLKGAHVTYTYVPDASKVEQEPADKCDFNKRVEHEMDISAFLGGALSDVRIQKTPRVDFENAKDGEVTAMRYSYKTKNPDGTEALLIGTLSFSKTTCEMVTDESLKRFKGAHATYKFVP